MVLPVQDRVPCALRQGPPRHRCREPHVRGERGQHPAEVLAGDLRPRRDRTVVEREVLVGDDQVRVDLELGAEAGALGARAVGRVEREGPRLDLVEGEHVVVRAGAVLGEPAFAVEVVDVSVDELDDEQAAGEPERGLDRVGQPTLHAFARDEPVDDHLDVVLELLLERGRLGQLDDLAVDPRTREALALQLLEEVGVLALAAADDRCEHLVPRALGELEQSVDDLLRRLRGDALAADRAVLGPRAGEQQTQVVVDLGDRADRRPRVPVGRLLVDRHRRREALDEVDVGLVHLPEELPRVRGERLDVPPLPLREDRVERQRRLARPRQPGEDDELVAREIEVDVAEVVLAGALHHQTFVHARESTSAH